MIFTLKQLENKAKNRPPNYKEEILLKSKHLGENKYELSEEDLKILSEKYRPKSVGLGTGIQNIIHFGIDIAPIPKRVKENIKNCNRCKKRVEKLNKIIPKIKRFTEDTFD